MLEWLIEIGSTIEQTDDFDTTPLVTAVECENAEAVDLLLRAGADVNSEQKHGQTVIGFAETREIATRLLEAGADPGDLAFAARRSLLGLDPESDEALLDISPGEFQKGWLRRFGTRNPERMVEPFWTGMIRAGVSAFQAAQFYGRRDHQSPVWCAQRFGQSLSLLPDGRAIQIAGEHEDSYDQDFCIYNDVFVHEQDGTIHIFGYPESVFPPTDFHTATLVREYLYIVGSLGYQGTRIYGTTPVYRLHTKNFRMEQVKARGEAQGWIYKHRALQTSADEIRIWGGQIGASEGNKEAYTKNERSFILDIKQLTWRAAD
jgi:hypothetical protein